MQKVKVRYYDGVQNIAHDATISLAEKGIYLDYQRTRKFYAKKDLFFIGRVGNILPAIELPDDARIEFLDEHIPEWLPVFDKKLYDLSSYIERSWKYVAIASIFTVGIIFSMVKWGIPVAAKHVAYHLPEQVLYEIGNQTQKKVMEMTTESQLSPQRQQQLIALYQKHIPSKPEVKIIFRKGGGQFGANAFAIPNNTMILTDELVELAQHDLEILGVMAHEQGHLIERHSLQQVLRTLGIGVIYIAITGDMVDFFSGLPALLIHAQYSQQFEYHADRYAVEIFKQNKLDPIHLAHFLQRLEGEYAHQPSKLESLMQTHPDTEKRIAEVHKHRHN